MLIVYWSLYDELIMYVDKFVTRFRRCKCVDVREWMVSVKFDDTAKENIITRTDWKFAVSPELYRLNVV